LQDIEFICVDDGGTDNSLRILKRFAAMDNRFKIASQKNAGYGAACNKGISLANGKYIGVLESDDFADPDFYADLVQLAEMYDCDFVKSDFYKYWTDSKRYTLIKNFDDALYGIVFTPGKIMKRFNLLEAPSSLWSAIYRRDMLERHKINFLETAGASYQDLSFSVKVFMASEAAYLTSRAYVYYRQSEGQSVKSLGKPWAVTREYAEIESRFPMTPEIFASKYHNYLWNYNRMGIEYRYHFLERFSSEFKKHLIDHEHILDEKFFRSWEPECLKMIVNAPLTYHDFRIREIYEQQEFHIIPADKPIADWTPAKKAFISIIAPCYNVERYVLSCLESLLNQEDADDVEIICVDDCSTDHTAAILEYTAKRDPRVKVISHSVNKGLSAARNTGLTHASGEFILFADSDDMLETNAIRILKSKLRGEKPVNVLNFSATVFPDEKNNDWLRKRFRTAGGYMGRCSSAAFFTRKEFCPFVWVNLIRGSLLDQKRLRFNESLRFGEDTLFLRRLFTDTEYIMLIPEKLYRYRMRDGSLMTQFNPHDQLNILNALFEDMNAQYVNFKIQPLIAQWSIDFAYASIIDSPTHIKEFLELIERYGYTPEIALSSRYQSILQKEFIAKVREAGLA
jgi:glycosyltransferase involved in cell wall biosynthesis